MKCSNNRALTLATAASLGLSLGIGNALAAQADQTGAANTNKVTGPMKQGIQMKASNQHKVSAQSKITSNQDKTSSQIKWENQGKTSNQGKFGYKVEEKDDGSKK